MTRRLLWVLFMAMAGVLTAQGTSPPDVEWRVRVVDPSGRAIEGASVRFRSGSDGATQLAAHEILTGADTLTDADGRATWRAWPHAEVWIGNPGCIPLLVSGAGVAAWDGVIDLGRIVLHPGKPLLARVRGPDRQGVAGVRALLSPAQTGSHGRPSVRTHLVAWSDPLGVIKIPAVPDGAFDLHLSHDDFLVRTLPCVTPRSPLDVELDPGALVTGRAVVAEGEVPRVYVEARTEVGRFYAEEDADGAFSVRVPSQVRYRMVFQGGAMRSPQLAGPIRRGESSGIEWTVPDVVPQLEVRCENAAGERVPDFEVAAKWGSDHTPPYSLIALRFGGAVRSKDGRARLDVDREWSPGCGVLRVRAPGYGETFVPVDAPASGETPAPVVVTLQPEVIVQGRVRRADTREPLAGVKVWAMPNQKGQIGYSSPSDLAVETDRDGRYQIRCLAPGTWTLEVHKPGWFRPFTEELRLDPAVESAVTFDDVELDPPETVKVQVVGLEDPARWFVERRIVPPNQGMVFMPGDHTSIRNATSLMEPSPWSTATGEIGVSVFTTSAGASPYSMRLAAKWEPGDDGVVRIRVDGGRVCRVSGRWQVEDYAFVERLAVQAHASAQGANGGWSGIRVDGTWGFEVTPGDYEFAVVDLATGIELWRGQPVAIGRDVDDIEIDPQFEVVKLDYVAAESGRPMPFRGAQIVDGPRKHSVPRELDILLLPPRPMTLSVRRTPPGQLNSTSLYLLESEIVESPWQPGTERWIVELPAALSDEELMQPAVRATGR